MCTIVVLHRVCPDYPLVVAANRDEFYGREASGPQRLVTEPVIVGGRDRRSGGTWLGVTKRGLFVGLTNQRTYQLPDPSLSSRGQVVVEALQTGSVAAVRSYLEGLDPSRYNSFNLVYGDGQSLEVAYGRTHERAVSCQVLEPGLHVLANDRLGSAEFPKTERAAALFAPVVQRGWPYLSARANLLLGDHQLPALHRVPAPPEGSVMNHDFIHQLQALCIHTPAYGTCSATLLALDRGRVAHYCFAPGPPCHTPFANYRALVTTPGG